ncbi:SLC13 family permease [Bosea sp. BK604]|uniref:SLC13 family permease n=1 Tax=Bosea sp. BK604 TaxID=2512180 RepID=UPI0010466D3F|nr:SLC13 family permease [Bosea sp. BK604]TCR65740.1 di/tricarboxylate transporter [Bosea sp. BK604]
MTQPQLLSVALIAVMMAAFLWGRLRYDIVALLALLIGLAIGVVPVADAFKGFSDDIVIIVGSALVMSAAVARSKLIERALSRISPKLGSTQLQVTVLVAAVAVLSAFIKNIGALAMMLPIAYQLARKSGKSPSVFLMPMAFGSLLGGIVTLVGTSPNVIVARVRQELTGEPFGMFDFTPVGLVIAVAGCAFLAVGYRLLPKDRRGAASLEAALDIKDYVTEAKVAEKSALAGKTVADLRAIGGGEVDIVSILRRERQLPAPLPDASLKPGDVLLLRGESDGLERVVAEGQLDLVGKDRKERKIAETGVNPAERVSEAVIAPGSLLVGHTAGYLDLHARHGVNVLAISRSGERLTERLRDIRLRTGDVVVVQGAEELLPETLAELGLLPLADRPVALGGTRRAWITGTILAGTIAALAFSLAPVPVVFFAAAVLLIAFRALPLREAYGNVEAPILLMLAALIPISDSLRATGATDVFAAWLAHIGASLPGWAAVGLMLVAAMAVTPFLNNAATVLVMAPIGAGFATQLGYRPDAFLMAVAIGAACDFLTPIGHQCNTLVMGPGGYRFSDYARLGAPLSLLVILLAVPAILLFFPLR